MTDVASFPPVDLGPDTSLFRRLLKVWADKRPMNLKRSVYYDGESALKDFGISLPPQMRGVRAALGWTAKGVHAVTDRSEFQGFVSPSGSEDPFGLAGIAADNRFDIEFPAANVSSAVHGCSFLTVTLGDTEAGEPEVQVLARPAEDSAAIWDPRRRELAGFLSVIAVDERAQPSEMVVYTPTAIHQLVKENGWVVVTRPNPIGRVTVAPLVHKFELRRPLGHSRITRASMYFVDAALRTLVRSEVSAEFYAADSYWLFGADVTKFVGDDKWNALMGRIKAMDVEDGEDKPQVTRFTGASPQPHTDLLRMWANLFADDQDLEVKFADTSNPASADAIFAAKESMITATKDANKLWGAGAVQAMKYAVMLRDGRTDVPAEMGSLSAQFTDPSIVSPSARADAFSKLTASIEGFGNSEVGMEYAGLTREQIVRFQAEQRRSQASSRVRDLVEAVRGLNGDAGASGGVSGGAPVVDGSGATGSA